MWHNCRRGWGETSQQPLTGWQPAVTTGPDKRQMCLESWGEKSQWCWYDRREKKKKKERGDVMHHHTLTHMQPLNYNCFSILCHPLAYLAYGNISHSVIGHREIKGGLMTWRVRACVHCVYVCVWGVSRTWTVWEWCVFSREVLPPLVTQSH